MLEFEGVTKRYGRKTAVADLSVTVMPGRVTGFLGPNGAGKSTCIRLLLGLGRPTSGRALIAGRRYREHVRPLRLVGAHLTVGRSTRVGPPSSICSRSREPVPCRRDAPMSAWILSD
jgi:ABC-2 type transport system ATP-binding protein